LLIKHYSSFNHIVDLACGTGESTKQLVQTINYKKCYAIDLAQNLLSIAKNKLNSFENIKFFLGDIDRKIFKSSYINLIFCNMGLQWSENLCNAINLLCHYLDKNGVFIFSMPISGNFPQINSSFKPTLPHHKTILKILLKNHFALVEYKLYTYYTEFKSQFDALKSLKSVGANYNKSSERSLQGLSKIKLENIFVSPENAQLTYKIGIYLAARKPS
jgi:ubiquinone/menaquinone biosynthesis C-methylase UbiE